MSSDTLGMFEALVLSAVQRLDGDGYGVSIWQEVQAQRGSAVALGACYGTLSRLEKKGYVKGRDGEPTPERGGRRKRHFEITGAGATALKRSRDAIERVFIAIPVLAMGGR